MSLISDPLYLIHISRIKFLRMDERGERIITFPPTVMSDDYVRLAAPVYPEMQYCYSFVYDNYMNDDFTNNNNVFGSALTTSSRTTKRNYRQRATNNKQPARYPYMMNAGTNANNKTGNQALMPGIVVERDERRGNKMSEESTDSEDDDFEIDKQMLHSGKPLVTDLNARRDASVTTKVMEEEKLEGDQDDVEEKELPPTPTAPAVATTPNTSDVIESAVAGAALTTATIIRSFPSGSLHPSVDSAIDPSPRSSIDDHVANAFLPIRSNSTNHTDDLKIPLMTTAAAHGSHSFNSPALLVSPSPLLEHTKKVLSPDKSLLKQQSSALSAMIAERAKAAENPFAEYSFVSGKGDSKPITLCVYLPTSNKPFKPITLVVRPDAITDDVIGYILYDYIEQKREPALDEQEYDLAEWVLLIAEDDGEIEDDLPAIDRTQNIGRVSFDQFALCRATPSQAKQNDTDRAKMGRSKPDMETLKRKKEAATTTNPNLSPIHPDMSALSPHSIPNIAFDMSPVHQPLADETHNEMANTLTTHMIQQQQQQEPDASTVAVPVPSSKATLTKATMPMTPLKYFRIKLMTSEEVSATTTIPVYAEMFIGDVLELVSRKRKLDPNEYMLLIADSNVIVPNDTTVESMKSITDLTLKKKVTQLSVSNNSTHLWRSPIKRKKDEVNHPMYFSTSDTSSIHNPGTTSNTNDNSPFSQYKKYTVSRKMPMFVSKRAYILAIDGDYIHLMPPENKGMFDSVKTTSFYAGAVKSCKQSKKVPTNFKIVILKESGFKNYDLEAESTKEASEICSRIRFLGRITKN